MLASSSGSLLGQGVSNSGLQNQRWRNEFIKKQTLERVAERDRIKIDEPAAKLSAVNTLINQREKQRTRIVSRFEGALIRSIW